MQLLVEQVIFTGVFSEFFELFCSVHLDNKNTSNESSPNSEKDEIININEHISYYKQNNSKSTNTVNTTNTIHLNLEDNYKVQEQEQDDEEDIEELISKLDEKICESLNIGNKIHSETTFENINIIKINSEKDKKISKNQQLENTICNVIINEIPRYFFFN